MITKVMAQNLSIDTSGIKGITSFAFPAKFQLAIELLLGLIMVAAFFSVIISGYLIITSGGDAAKATQGKKGIIMSIIGIVVISLAFVIVRTFGNAVNSL